jgi:hypothetical protein
MEDRALVSSRSKRSRGNVLGLAFGHRELSVLFGTFFLVRWVFSGKDTHDFDQA